ncbi:uncharacterized protein LOC110348307 [Heterocephalus glaber]|uniref:Uncharacterized protein LOC110348307 n=1 Tax=Heterocephalus glaber TaxID=10181 RepID=A0AAX6SRY4_HETGA|nr:uncharacterized protein LOC110348307 [Heterocephalus glaber]
MSSAPARPLRDLRSPRMSPAAPGAVSTRRLSAPCGPHKSQTTISINHAASEQGDLSRDKQPHGEPLNRPSVGGERGDSPSAWNPTREQNALVTSARGGSAGEGAGPEPAPRSAVRRGSLCSPQGSGPELVSGCPRRGGSSEELCGSVRAGSELYIPTRPVFPNLPIFLPLGKAAALGLGTWQEQVPGCAFPSRGRASAPRVGPVRHQAKVPQPWRKDSLEPRAPHPRPGQRGSPGLALDPNKQGWVRQRRKLGVAVPPQTQGSELKIFGPDLGLGTLGPSP